MAVPGLEDALAVEAKACGFRRVHTAKGGVTVRGGWTDVWRANLELRGASRIIARIAEFRAFHLAQLDKRARRVPWRDVLRPDMPFRVEASCTKSKIYHSGAAAQRIERAIREELGAPVSPDAVIRVMVRIEDDLCSIGVDTSGEPLHKRGHKLAVNKAPLRETMAALYLQQCGYDGREPVLDPMCGSGTFVIEAAEIATGLKPGRTRNFAFEQLAGFDARTWQNLRSNRNGGGAGISTGTPSLPRFFGSDRDAGAIAMSHANAERSGVAEITRFAQLEVDEIQRPEGPPGLVIVNPPYGARIGDAASLHDLYRSLGRTLLARFTGWRVGLVTSEAALARATGLPFGKPAAPVLHGGLRVTLYRTAKLP